MELTEREMTRLSLLMASLVSSPAQAVRFVELLKENPGEDASMSILNKLLSQIEDSASGEAPSLLTLRKAVESLVAQQGSEPAVTAGKLLSAALEKHPRIASPRVPRHASLVVGALREKPR